MLQNMYFGLEIFMPMMGLELTTPWEIFTWQWRIQTGSQSFWNPVKISKLQ